MNPQRMHPDLYKAAAQGDVDLLHKFLASQELQQLDGADPLEAVAHGDNTVFHIVATSSNPELKLSTSTSNYIEFARAIFTLNRSLLMVRNKLQETPLHCAAKAMNDTMVAQFISFAVDEEWFGEETYLVATNLHGETALHEAVQSFESVSIVNRLVHSEPRLAGIVDGKGVSPLYLAVMRNALQVVRVFTGKEPSSVSCVGPNGQTAIHVAVLQHNGITKELLEWDPSLTTRVDDSGSTALHYAASIDNVDAVKLLLHHGTSAAYMADNEGLYPIHVAAKCGSAFAIKQLIEQIPGSGEFLDNHGRNLLHTAVVNGRDNVVLDIMKDPIFLRMMNARDYQGNTPLHLACMEKQYNIVRWLVSKRMVHLSIMNNDNLTPVDVTMEKLDRGWRHSKNKQYNVLRCLLWSGALPSSHRVDHICK